MGVLLKDWRGHSGALEPVDSAEALRDPVRGRERKTERKIL
jgi:hypothetical protein